MRLLGGACLPYLFTTNTGGNPAGERCLCLLQAPKWSMGGRSPTGRRCACRICQRAAREFGILFLIFCGSSNLIRQIEWCATILVDANDAPLMMQRSTRECVRPSTPGPGAYSNQSGKRPASQLDPRSLWGLWYSSRQKLPPEALQQQSHL